LRPQQVQNLRRVATRIRDRIDDPSDATVWSYQQSRSTDATRRPARRERWQAQRIAQTMVTIAEQRVCQRLPTRELGLLARRHRADTPHDGTDSFELCDDVTKDTGLGSAPVCTR